MRLTVVLLARILGDRDEARVNWKLASVSVGNFGGLERQVDGAGLTRSKRELLGLNDDVWARLGRDDCRIRVDDIVSSRLACVSSNQGIREEEGLTFWYVPTALATLPLSSV